MKKSIAPNDLRILVEEYVTTYPETVGRQNIWRAPLLATAEADSRFDILPRIAAEDHALPQDLLPSAKSAVVFFVPFKKELCLHKNGYQCLVCVKRCPVSAVSESGIDRKRCWERLNFNLNQTEELVGLENTTHVCGKCQVIVPCSLKMPKEK